MVIVLLMPTPKKEGLRCPASHPQYYSAYDTLEKDITDFESINALPDGIKLTYLNDGSGIAKTLLANNALYHKSCRSNCNGNMFKREGCKRVSQSQTPTSPKKTRSSFNASFNRMVPARVMCGRREDLHKVFPATAVPPDFDLDNFFKYENQKEPPSMSDQGKLRSGTKSDVLQCLTIPKLTPPDGVTVKVLDGPAVVRMVRPTYGTNYQQNVVRHFMPFITNSLTNSTSRLDIIWDIYPDHNLKAQAQAKRGNPGVTTIVEGSTPVPRDWNKFLANSRNKVQLFRFLSNAIIEASSQFTDVVVCSTYW